MFEFKKNAEVPGLALLFQEMLETEIVSTIPNDGRVGIFEKEYFYF